MAEQYKVSLGIGLDDKQLNSVKTTINNLVDKERKINLDIDFNIKNANRLVEAGKEIEKLQTQIRELNNIGSTGKNKTPLSFNTKSLEQSLNKINETIKKLQNAFGKVDKNRGVQSLLTTVTKIGSELSNVSKQFGELDRNLSSLSGKDFSLNFDFGLGNSSKNPEQAIKQLNMLKKEVEEYERYFAKHYSIKNNEDPISRLLLNHNQRNQLYGLQLRDAMTKGSDVQKIGAYKEYIKLIKETAAMGNISLAPVDFRLAESGEFVKVRNEVDETEKKLKELFSGGIDATRLHQTLNEISQGLIGIQTILQDLSKGVKIEGLTASFDKLSNTLDRLMANAKSVQDVLGSGLGNASVNSGVEQAIQDQKELAQTSTQTANVVVQNEERKQQAIEETSNAYNKISKDTSLVRDDSNFRQAFEDSNQAAQEAQRHFQELLADEKAVVTVSEQFDKSNALQSFVVNVKRASGEVETLRYALVNLADQGEEERWGFVYQGASANDSKVERQLESHIKKANDLQIKLDKIKSGYSDMGSAKPIKDSSHIEALDKQYRKVERAIADVRNADNSTFSSMISNAEKEKSALENMVREFRNAENIATSLRSKDIDTVKSTYASKLDVLISKMQSSGVYTSGFENGAENLRSILSSATDASGLVKFLNGLDKLESGYKRADVAVKEFNRSQKVGINVSGLESKIADIQRISPEIDQFKTEINGAEVSVKSLLSDLSKVKTQGDFSVVNSKFKAFADAAKAAGIAVTETATKMKSVNEIKLKMEHGTFDNDISQMHEKFNKLSGASKELRNSVALVENAYREMEAALKGTGDEVADREKLIQAEKAYADALEKTNNLLRIQAREEKALNDSDKLDYDITAFKLEVDTWLKNNSAAAKRFGSTMSDLKARANDVDRVTLNGLIRQFRLADKEAEKLGLKGLNNIDKLKAKFSEYATYLSAAEVFSWVSQGLRDMFEQVKLIDSAMTELKKVTNETDEAYNKFLSNAADRSKEIGTTIDGFVKSTADFARLGYGFQDAQGLAGVANIYAVVGDEINGVEGATESLISTMAAFKDEMNGMSNTDFAMSIIDKFNEIGNNFAISSGGIGEALERSASSLMAANNTIDESIALITAANTVVQEPASVGTAFKTISMRIRGAKTELEEAGLETEGMVESTAKLRSEIIALSGVDIMEADGKTFKSTYKIMDELAVKWKDLTDIQQATVTELIAGKRQGNIVSSLMTNFDTAREALETSLGSEGSAMAEHEKASESLEFKLNELKASWQALAQAFMDTDFLKGGIDALSGLVNILEKLIDTFGVLGTVGVGYVGKNVAGSIIGSFKNATKNSATTTNTTATNANTAATNSDTTTANANTTAKQSNTAAINANTTARQSNTAVANADVASTNADTTSTNLNTAAEKTNTTATNIDTIAEQSHTVATNADVVATNIDTTATNANTAAEKANTTATNANAGAITKLTKSTSKTVSTFSKLTSAIGGWIGVTSIAITVISAVVNAIKNAKEEAAALRQETIETSDEFLNAAGTFEKAYIKYSGRTNLTTEEENELNNAINGTVDALGDKSSALQTAVNSSSDYVAALEAIARAEREAAASAAKNKKDAAGETLKETVKGWVAFDGSEVDVNIVTGSNISSKKEAQIAQQVGEKYYATLNKSSQNVVTVGFQIDPKASTDEIIDYYYTLIEYREKLEDAGLKDTNAWTRTNDVIKKMSESVEAYTDSLYEAAKAQYQLDKGIPKTTEEYLKMRRAILNDKDIKNLTLAEKNAIANSLDSSYKGIFDLSSAEVQARKLLGVIKSWGDGSKDGTNEVGTVETLLNMRTAVNNNECTVGEYMSQFEKLEAITYGLTDEEKKIINSSFGIDTDSIKKQYEDTTNYIMRFFREKSKDESHSDYGHYKGSAKQKVEEFLGSLTADELSALVSIRTEIDWKNANAEDIRKQIADMVEINEAMDFTIAIDVETEGIEALNAALSQSRSATGLATESIEALKARYEDLDGYNAATLFEETANGIRINSTELAKLEKEYKKFNKQEADKTLKILKKEYDNLTDEINSCTGDQKKLNKLYSERDAIVDQINDVATLAAQYEGLTSAYNEWLNAQEAGQDRDMYESIISGREEIEEEMSRGWLDDAAIEYLELLTGKELSTTGIDAQIAAYKELSKEIGDSGYSIWDFFTEDEDGNSTSDGVYNFFDTVKSVAGETAAYIDENGKYHFDFEGIEYNGKTGDAAIAEMLGTSEEFVQIMFRAAEDAGFTVHIKGDYTDLANMSDDIHNLNEQLKSIGATDYTFNIDTTDVEYAEEQITEAKSALQYFEDRDGKINLDDSDVRAAATILSTLIFKKSELENPTLMHLDVSNPTTKLEEVLGLAQQLKNAKANLEIQTEIGADTTEAQAEVDSLLAQLSSDKYAEITASLNINPSSVDSAIASINAISSQQMIDLGLETSKIDGYVPPEKEATVTYNKDSTEVDEYDPPDFTRTVTFNVDSYSVDIYDPSNLTRTVTYKVKKEGEISEANGTANVNGTAFANGTVGGRAFKQGNWGIKGSSVALGGELGTEILVRDGKWYTIGDNGAEFFKYRQGDIIFNHRQAEELFANGKVTSNGGRGKALAEGTAFKAGSGALGGSGRNFISSAVRAASNVVKNVKSKTTTKETKDGVTVNNSTTVGSTADGGVGKDAIKDSLREDSNAKDKDKFEETFDWIEIAISRIEREIDNLDQTVNNVYKSWSDRNTALKDEISKVSEEIELQNNASTKYLNKAKSVGLDESYAKKVREGSLNIEDFEGENDEALVEKIKEYQKWYDLYIECIDKAEKLKQTEAELYEQRFENVQSQYEGILQGFEHTEFMLTEYISQAEAKGQIVSQKYYQALIDNEKNNIAKLQQEQSALIAKRDEAVASGAIKKGSEAWYNMCQEIDNVTQSIEQGNTALIEYSNSIRDIEWQVFDLIQEGISDVTSEADFLIELMSNSELFDDNAKLNDKGMATMGLHSQKYNDYMYASDEYGKEITKLNKEIAKDPYNQDLINRRRELIELQRESILNAEQEKQAIKDLIAEGIEKELDLLQEKIDKTNEALDSQKD